MNVLWWLAMLCVASVRGVTFELERHGQECFFEPDHAINAKCRVRFQVQAGGSLDVDLDIYDPNGKTKLLRFSVAVLFV